MCHFKVFSSVLFCISGIGCGMVSIGGEKVALVAHRPFVDPASDHPPSLKDAAPQAEIALRKHLKDQSRDLYSLDVPDFKKHFAGQKEADWCWAACIQMILSRERIEVTQKEIVDAHGATLEKKLDGSEGDAATIAGICNALQAHYADLPEKRRIITFPFVRTMHEAVEDIHFGHPMIALLLEEGNMGHAYVLTGLDVSFTSQGFLDRLRYPERKPLTPPKEAAEQKKVSFSTKGAKEQPSSAGRWDIQALLRSDPAKLADPPFHLRLGDAFTSSDVVLHEVRLFDPLTGGEDPVRMRGDEFKKKLRYAVRVRVVRKSQTAGGR